MQTVYKSDNGTILQGDNLEVLSTLADSSVDSCISDFPYNLSFMGKSWDTMKNFYDWNLNRAQALYRVLKPGGYVAIFSHVKTNHRMKCAFEDAGFRIVDEIDWIFCTGLPKNQDIGKLFDKAAGAERTVIGRDMKAYRPNAVKAHKDGQVGAFGLKGEGSGLITEPATEQAKVWDGWKTAGLKPAHEPITIFQKPLDGTYVQNIEQHGCGGMNIEACRVPIEGNDDGRFPPNIIMSEEIAEEFDTQTGQTKSTGGSGELSRIGRARKIYGAYRDKTNDSYENESLGGYGDSGGGSRMFPIIKYCPKASPQERMLPNGERNPHVTLKPVELIKWLIRLLTPKKGVTIDATAGSGTHGLACELLNKEEDYELKWTNIEIDESYCTIGKMRIEEVHNGK